MSEIQIIVPKFHLTNDNCFEIYYCDCFKTYYFACTEIPPLAPMRCDRTIAEDLKHECLNSKQILITKYQIPYFEFSI